MLDNFKEKIYKWKINIYAIDTGKKGIFHLLLSIKFSSALDFRIYQEDINLTDNN